MYALVAHVEDRVGANMRCHTISLASVESTQRG